MHFRFSVRYLSEGQLYADEITSTNLLAVEKLTSDHLFFSCTSVEIKNKIIIKKRRLHIFLSKLIAFILRFQTWNEEMCLA